MAPSCCEQRYSRSRLWSIWQNLDRNLWKWESLIHFRARELVASVRPWNNAQTKHILDMITWKGGQSTILWYPVVMCTWKARPFWYLTGPYRYHMISLSNVSPAETIRNQCQAQENGSDEVVSCLQDEAPESGGNGFRMLEMSPPSAQVCYKDTYTISIHIPGTSLSFLPALRFRSLQQKTTVTTSWGTQNG